MTLKIEKLTYEIRPRTIRGGREGNVKITITNRWQVTRRWQIGDRRQSDDRRQATTGGKANKRDVDSIKRTQRRRRPRKKALAGARWW